MRTSRPLRWVVRTHGDPHQLIAAVTEQLRLASGGFPVAHVRTMDEIVGRSTARQSFNMLLLTIFGAVALVLAAIGIYGVDGVLRGAAHAGDGHSHGAGRGSLRDSQAGGVARHEAGADWRGDWHGAAFGLTRLIASFLFGVKSWDPAVFVSAPLILAAVALVAVWLPATRASKVDPMQALRAD